jgi:hypothetical protein
VTDEIDVLRTFRDETPGPSTDAWARARAAIAAARSEEEEPTIFPNATGPGRRRRFTIAGVTGVAAAVAGLLAVLLPGSPAAAPVPALRIQTAAYVARVEQALSESGQASLVGYSRTTLPPGSSVVLMADALQISFAPAATPSSGLRTLVRWSYQGTDKISAFTAAGRPVFDERLTAAGGGPAEAVIYGSATWWRTAPTGTQAPVPQTCGKGVDLGAGGWPAFIRFELTCGAYLMHSRERVDGVDALKLTGNRGLVALWVDPKTYLPVRAVFDLGQRPVQTDFRWLPPTSASLAHLSLQVPPGFRQVRPPA